MVLLPVRVFESQTFGAHDQDELAVLPLMFTLWSSPVWRRGADRAPLRLGVSLSNWRTVSSSVYKLREG